MNPTTSGSEHPREPLGQAEAAEKYVEDIGLLMSNEQFKTENQDWTLKQPGKKADGSAIVKQGGSFTETLAQALYGEKFATLNRAAVQDVLNIWIRAEQSGLLTSLSIPGDQVKVVYDATGPEFKMNLEFTPSGSEKSVTINLLSPSPEQLKTLDDSRKSRLDLPALNQSALENARRTSSISAAMMALGFKPDFQSRVSFLKGNADCIAAINAKVSPAQRIKAGDVESTYKGTREQNLAFLDWVITDAQSVAVGMEPVEETLIPEPVRKVVPEEPVPPLPLDKTTPPLDSEPVESETEKSVKELKEEMDALHDKIDASLRYMQIDGRKIFRELTVDVDKVSGSKPAAFSATVRARLSTGGNNPSYDQAFKIKLNPATVSSVEEGSNKPDKAAKLEAKIGAYARLDAAITQIRDGYKQIYDEAYTAELAGDHLGYQASVLEGIFNSRLSGVAGAPLVDVIDGVEGQPIEGAGEVAPTSPETQLTALLDSQWTELTAPGGTFETMKNDYSPEVRVIPSRDSGNAISVRLLSPDFDVKIHATVPAVTNPMVGFKEATYSGKPGSNITIEGLPAGALIQSGDDLAVVSHTIANFMQKREQAKSDEYLSDLEDAPLGAEAMTEGERVARAKLDSSWTKFTKDGGILSTIKMSNPSFGITAERTENNAYITISKDGRIVKIQVRPNIAELAKKYDGGLGYFEPVGPCMAVRRTIQLNGSVVTTNANKDLDPGFTFSQGINGVLSTWDKDLAAETARISLEATSTIPGKKVETLTAAGSSIVDLTGMTNVTQDDFQREAVEASSGGKTVVVEFVNGSTGSTQGSAQLRAWANATPGITVVRINSTATAVSTSYDLSSFPAFVVFKNGTQFTTGAVHSLDDAKK